MRKYEVSELRGKKCFIENRYGILQFSVDVVDKLSDDFWEQTMSDFYVVDYYRDLYTRTIKYACFSDLFNKVNEYECGPEYLVTFCNTSDGMKIISVDLITIRTFYKGEDEFTEKVKDVFKDVEI